MKIANTVGHTLTGIGSGAIGLVNESVENRKNTSKLTSFLEIFGHDVTQIQIDKANTQKDYLNYIAREVNKGKYDLAIQNHLNSFKGGQGCEVLVYKTGGIAEKIGKEICKNMEMLGFKNRGVKVRQDLHFLKATNCPSILIEWYFCDSKIDVEIANRCKEMLALIIAEAVQ